MLVVPMHPYWPSWHQFQAMANPHFPLYNVVLYVPHSFKITARHPMVCAWLYKTTCERMDVKTKRLKHICVQEAWRYLQAIQQLLVKASALRPVQERVPRHHGFGFSACAYNGILIIGLCQRDFPDTLRKNVLCIVDVPWSAVSIF